MQPATATSDQRARRGSKQLAARRTELDLGEPAMFDLYGVPLTKESTGLR